MKYLSSQREQVVLKGNVSSHLYFSSIISGNPFADSYKALTI